MSDKRDKSSLITPRTLKGFRDYLPEAMIPRERLMETARRVYRSYGFAPIDTPALEYLEILIGKGGDETDKQMYRFEDNGGRAVGMRFDLTVPLSRFVAQHINELGTPFKRYQIATVWRGEKPARGRYREFMQCDFDTIGTRSITADIETTLVIHDLMQAVGFENFTIHVNNRQVLTGLLEQLGLADQSTLILRALDKLAKIGREKVAEEMTAAAGASTDQAGCVLDLTELSGSSDEILSQLGPLIANSAEAQEGAAKLEQLLAATKAAGVGEDRLKLDLSIARGLDYYTGTIYETFLGDLPDIGSVCSGGRYDDLAGTYTLQELPGVGASLGLDRLLSAMEELEMIQKVSTPADVFIAYFQSERLHDYLLLASKLRARGLCVEVYPEPKKLGQQLKYADRQGFRVALILGDEEFEAARCQVKDMATGDKQDVPLEDDAASITEAVEKILSR